MFLSSRDPFYFYHLLPISATLTKDGIVSPEYWYRKGDTIRYLKCADKYRYRLVHDWKIYPEANPNTLTVEQIHEGINIFRNNKDGNNYIYLFRYLPYKGLGPNMEDVLNSKLAFQIDIESGIARQYIKKIDWGHWLSNTANRSLNRHYYATVSEDQYFRHYKDSDKPLYKSLHRIGIVPKDTYLPLVLWEEIEIR